MRKFNTIKKSRKKSKDIDEKIEYLNKECQKTGLQEVMTTSNMYQGTTKVPNQAYNDFNGLSQGGYALGLSADEGDSLGGAGIGINPSTGQTGVALSPPHPVTGVRRVASTVTDGVGSNRALRPGKGTRVRGTNDDGSPRVITDGSAVWFWDPNYNLGGIQGKWYNFEWLDGQLGFWDTNFLGFFFHNTNLDQFQLSGSNVGTEIKNKLAGINFGSNGAVGEPQTTVLTKNDLGDPGFIPIDTMSPQAYQYLYGKATGSNVASSGANYDLYNWILKTYGMEAAEWYLKSGKSQGNPYLPTGAYVPRADAGKPDPDGTNVALFGFGGGGGGKPINPAVYGGKKGALDRDIKKFNKMSPLGGGPGGVFKLSHVPEGDLLSEDAKLGHFEPEVLNVDINDIRKGIMPEFPKDPPEMIGGYSAKSKLVRKEPELPPFIKVTRKDLAKNHKLTDKEISQYMDEINAINDYIKKNPAELLYAMTRYPKDDPRLAQLNFKMDEMKRASDQYVETHFPENVSLFNKLQNKIKQNIEMTNPDNFTGHAEAPKFIKTDISEQEKRRKTIIRHFKKKK